MATDVVEHDDHFEMRMEIPGMDRADLKVEIQGGHITVSGEKRAETTRKSGSAVVTERAFGSFRRVLPLPASVAAEDVQARYVDGVLAIDMPKQSGEASRQIDVA